MLRILQYYIFVLLKIELVGPETNKLTWSCLRIYSYFSFETFFSSQDIRDLVILYIEFDDATGLIDKKLKYTFYNKCRSIISVPIMKLGQVVEYLIAMILIKYSIQKFGLDTNFRPLYIFRIIAME